MHNEDNLETILQNYCKSDNFGLFVNKIIKIIELDHNMRIQKMKKICPIPRMEQNLELTKIENEKELILEDHVTSKKVHTRNEQEKLHITSEEVKEEVSEEEKKKAMFFEISESTTEEMESFEKQISIKEKTKLKKIEKIDFEPSSFCQVMNLYLQEKKIFSSIFKRDICFNFESAVVIWIGIPGQRADLGHQMLNLLPGV
jgi:hypothetical protein